MASSCKAFLLSKKRKEKERTISWKVTGNSGGSQGCAAIGVCIDKLEAPQGDGGGQAGRHALHSPAACTQTLANVDNKSNLMKYNGVEIM
jgi:hypothetical protein